MLGVPFLYLSFPGAVRTARLFSCVSRLFAFEGDEAIMQPVSLEHGRVYKLSH